MKRAGESGRCQDIQVVIIVRGVAGDPRGMNRLIKPDKNPQKNPQNL